MEMGKLTKSGGGGAAGDGEHGRFQQLRPPKVMGKGQMEF